MTSAHSASAPDDVFGLIGCTLDKRIRIETVVAEGGFGVVYYGTQLALEKPVAVKVLKTPNELTEKERKEFGERFALEARTVAKLAHPNIVQPIDFGVITTVTGQPAPWMALEWASGRTLSQLLAARRGKGGQKPREVLTVVRPILQALSYAHDMGIVHRDVKPSNIMVSETRRDVVPRLMDFGIAKVMEADEVDGENWVEEKTRSTQRVFSLRYAAPEQISGTRTGPWTDVHAMALIVMEMLTDEPPYQSREVTALYGEILSPERPTPASRALDAGPWEHVLRKALALNPAERFHHAADFLAALEAEVPAAVRSTSTLDPTQATRADGSGAWSAGNSAPARPPAVQPSAAGAPVASEVSAPAANVTGTGFSGSFPGPTTTNRGGTRWGIVVASIVVILAGALASAWILRVPHAPMPVASPVPVHPAAATPSPPTAPPPTAAVAPTAPEPAPAPAPAADSPTTATTTTTTTATTTATNAPASDHRSSTHGTHAGSTTGSTGTAGGSHGRPGGRHAVNFSVE